MITKDNPCADCAFEEGSNFCLTHCPYDAKRVHEPVSISDTLPTHYGKDDLIHRETARRIISSPRTQEQMLAVLASVPSASQDGDLISRQAVINVLKNEFHEDLVIEILSKLPSVSQAESADIQKAIQAVENEK